MGGKRKPLVLFHLQHGPKRFGELRRLITGISEKVLTQQLREQAEDGIAQRTDHHEVPPRVNYAMTTFGQTLAQALMPLCAWGDRRRPMVEALVRSREERVAF